jgi:hypothetical protein
MLGMRWNWRWMGPIVLLGAIVPCGVRGLALGAAMQEPAQEHEVRRHVGFDRNEYPGDAALPELRKHFAFTGYWLTNPPESASNSWVGKREILMRHEFGFLVLANGKLDKEIKKAGVTPEALGRRDAADAVAAARREGFPAKTIVFLDQEEGGVLLPEQAAYLLAWTEAVAGTGYLPGVYCSGQPVPAGKAADGTPQTVTTAQDIRRRVAAARLHEIALWVAQDACPPANGCSVEPPALQASGTPGAVAWQYAQSPRRKAITAACAASYARDGNCYAPGLPVSLGLHIDLSVADSADPSHGR